MTTKRTGSKSKRSAKKLSLKKETLKDLGARDARRIKGGTLVATGGCGRFGASLAGCGRKTDATGTLAI
jgi:hypothetical protein